MRTTLTIDDEVARRLKDMAHRSGQSFKQVVNQALRAGMERMGRRPRRGAVHLRTFRMGAPTGGLNLDKGLQLAGELENEEIVRKVTLRK